MAIITNTKQYLDTRFLEGLANLVEARFRHEVGSISYNVPNDGKLVIRIGFKDSEKKE
jgi:hypothetical protein